MIVLKATPQFLLVPLLAQRRSENVLRAFKPRRIHVLEREVQILRTSLGVDGKSAVASFPNFLQRLMATQVDDVDGCARHLGQRNGTSYGLGFRGCRASQCVILRRALSLR